MEAVRIFREGNRAGFDFSAEGVPVACNGPISRIAEGFRKKGENGKGPPEAAEVFEDVKDGIALQKRGAGIGENNQRISYFGIDAVGDGGLAGKRRSEGGKGKAFFPVVPENPGDQAGTKGAIRIKEDDVGFFGLVVQGSGGEARAGWGAAPPGSEDRKSKPYSDEDHDGSGSFLYVLLGSLNPLDERAGGSDSESQEDGQCSDRQCGGQPVSGEEWPGLSLGKGQWNECSEKESCRNGAKSEGKKSTEKKFSEHPPARQTLRSDLAFKTKVHGELEPAEENEADENQQRAKKRRDESLQGNRQDRSRGSTPCDQHSDK